ncbi:hypothetical protein ZHAS_00006555 [Anopheles sinensis]|uniref:Uncharacterized protein n=1 Tax=Anopheles sinensis TaxID=74873 RepID=A0A084VMM0_ANOSI|nr:hypothetical protein ZHAS_00006555 [Anopheles sinensis]
MSPPVGRSEAPEQNARGGTRQMWAPCGLIGNMTTVLCPRHAGKRQKPPYARLGLHDAGMREVGEGCYVAWNGIVTIPPWGVAPPREQRPSIRGLLFFPPPFSSSEEWVFCICSVFFPPACAHFIGKIDQTSAHRGGASRSSGGSNFFLQIPHSSRSQDEKEWRGKKTSARYTTRYAANGSPRAGNRTTRLETPSDKVPTGVCRDGTGVVVVFVPHRETVQLLLRGVSSTESVRAKHDTTKEVVAFCSKRGMAVRPSELRAEIVAISAPKSIFMWKPNNNPKPQIRAARARKEQLDGWLDRLRHYEDVHSAPESRGAWGLFLA